MYFLLVTISLQNKPKMLDIAMKAITPLQNSGTLQVE
jgi:hypothetical protein